MKLMHRTAVMLAIFFLLSFGIVYAQEEEIILKISRDFGYASGTGKIQGLFSMKATSFYKLAEVVFYIDSQPIGKDSIEPFKLQFNTDDFSQGMHSLYAIGIGLDGNEFITKEIRTEFISAQDSKKATLTLIIPILGLSLIAVIISAVFPVLFTKKKETITPGAHRFYGAAGGTICTGCNRPFSRHLLAPNLVLGKLERCPHCGKWGIYRAYPIDILRKAEETELEADYSQKANIILANEEDRLRNEVDDTKYQGM